MMEISDEDILAENQAVNRADDGTLKEIQSLDGELESAGSLDAEAGGETQAADSAGSSEPAGSETEAAGLENPGEAVLTGGTSVSEYIAGVQLSREQIRAKNKETLMELINNGQIPDTEKQAAIQSMIRMTEISEKGKCGGDPAPGQGLCGSGGQHHRGPGGCGGQCGDSD